MYNHAPKDYKCPICLGVAGIENEDTLIRQSDIVYRDDLAMVFIASYFIGSNSGHLIIVPTSHYENLYELPDEVGQHIFTLSKRMALVMKQAYACEGVTTQQNNEPAGGQHAFHYHLHLFPRYTGDNIYQHMGSKRTTDAEERLPFAEKIRQTLG
jgi:histidine triad (HIT) family protein